MSIASIFKWIFRIFIFALVLILIMDNIQTVRFNLLGIYYLQVPLIVIVLIFLGFGFLIGLLIGFMNNMKLKSRIHQLEEVATTPKHSQVV